MELRTLCIVSNNEFTYQKTVKLMLPYLCESFKLKTLTLGYDKRSVVRLPGPSDSFLASFFRMLTSCYQVYRLVLDSDVELYLVNNRNASFPFRFLKRLGLLKAGVKVIYFARGLYFHPDQRSWVNKLCRAVELFLGKSDELILTQSVEDALFLKRRLVDREKVRYVGNGVVMPPFEDDANSTVAKDFDICVSGRITPEKRSEIALKTSVEAARLLGRKLKVVFIGDTLDERCGKWWSDCKKSLLATCDVEFTETGFVDRQEVFQFLRRSRVYLHCSNREGVPRSLLEAVFCGCIPLVLHSRGNFEILLQLGMIENIFSTEEGATASLVKVLDSRDSVFLVRDSFKAFYSYDEYARRVNMALNDLV